MKNRPIAYLVGISLALYGIHKLLLEFLLPAYNVEGIYKIHLFLGIVTVALVYLLEKVRKKNQERFGQLYLVSVVLKMFLSVGFLAPVIFGENQIEKLYVVHFFSAFFIYLFMEVYALTSLLKK